MLRKGPSTLGRRRLGHSCSRSSPGDVPVHPREAENLTTGFVEEMVHTFLWKEARSRVRTYSRTGCTLHDPWTDCYREEKVTDISWWCAQ